MEGNALHQTLVGLLMTKLMLDGPALIILALVTANIRNCRLPSSKVRALDVLLALSCRLTDEAKLDRMVPYIIELLHDESALVRSAALRTLMQTVRRYTPVQTRFHAYCDMLAAHACHSDYTVKRIYISGIHHPQHQAFGS